MDTCRLGFGVNFSYLNQSETTGRRTSRYEESRLQHSVCA
jgi:hypothetical protein